MDRDYIVGLAYMVIGVCASIVIGMIFFSPESGRIHLDSSIPRAIGGVFVGCLIGSTVTLAYRKYGRGQSVIPVLTTVLLWTGIASPLGWLLGDTQATNFEDREHYTRLGMVFGAISGAIIGLSSGLWIEWRMKQRSRSE